MIWFVKRGVPHKQTEDVGAEVKLAVRRAYLVTFSHPQKTEAISGTPLRAPGEFSREEICVALLHALAEQQESSWGGRPLTFEKMVVFREAHEDGKPHYHVALMANQCFRFGAFKKLLLAQSQLASHWSSSHDAYATCVAYGYLPRVNGPEAELDPTPYVWVRLGAHPPLWEASRPMVTAKATAQRRELARRALAAKGESELRFQAVDLTRVSRLAIVRTWSLKGTRSPFKL